MLEHCTAQSWKKEVSHILKWVEPKGNHCEQNDIENSAKFLEHSLGKKYPNIHGENFCIVLKVYLWAQPAHLYATPCKDTTLT